MCLSHLICTVRPCLIHTCYAASVPCSDHTVLLKATAQHGRRETAVLCRSLEKNGIVRAWHGRGIASVNQTRPHCANQMGKTHYKPLAARHGQGMLCVNRPFTRQIAGSNSCPEIFQLIMGMVQSVFSYLTNKYEV